MKKVLNDAVAHHDSSFNELILDRYRKGYVDLVQSFCIKCAYSITIARVDGAGIVGKISYT